MSNYLKRNKSGNLLMVVESEASLNFDILIEDNILTFSQWDGSYSEVSLFITVKNKEKTETFTETITSSSKIDLNKYLEIKYENQVSISISPEEGLFQNFEEVILKKSLTSLEELVIENGMIKKFIGISEYAIIDNPLIKGIGSDFYLNTGACKNFVIRNIEIIEDNAFCFSDVNIKIEDSEKLYIGDCAFENFSGNLSINKDVIVSFGSSVFDNSTTESVEMTIDRERFNFKENAFKNSNIEYLHLRGEKPYRDRKFFEERYFEGCSKLKEIICANVFNNVGTYKKASFKNCEKLETIYDAGDERIGFVKGLLPLDLVEAEAFMRCASLPNKTVFLIFEEGEYFDLKDGKKLSHPGSVIRPTSFNEVSNMTVLYCGKEKDIDKIKERFNLPGDSYVCTFLNNYPCNDYMIRGNDDFVFFHHKLSQKAHYHYLLKYRGETDKYSFKSFSNYSPFRICKYCFLNSDIKSLYIPKGTYIEKDAFVNCPNLVLYFEDYPENIDWKENIKNIPVKWGIKETTYAEII